MSSIKFETVFAVSAWAAVGVLVVSFTVGVAFFVYVSGYSAARGGAWHLTWLFAALMVVMVPPLCLAGITYLRGRRPGRAR